MGVLSLAALSKLMACVDAHNRMIWDAQATLTVRVARQNLTEGGGAQPPIIRARLDRAAINNRIIRIKIGRAKNNVIGDILTCFGFDSTPSPS
jgi:hypothetical protein